MSLLSQVSRALTLNLVSQSCPLNLDKPLGLPYHHFGEVKLV